MLQNTQPLVSKIKTPHKISPTNATMSEELLLNTFSDIRNRLSRLSARFLKNEDDVNDTLQEAFCRLWPRRASIGSREEAEALSVTTVRNLSIDALRQQAHTATDDLPDAAALADDTTTDWDEREALFRDVERLIRTRLTPTQQTILRRREYEGASFETIADELSMQPAAVRMQLSRARKIIRECYQQQSHE